jgi:probable F420-dependent oxidoreductase
VLVSIRIPTDRVTEPAFVGAAGVARIATAVEAAGFDGVWASEHPAPPAAWIAGGGHHALDAVVSLSAVAMATTRIRLQTVLLVAPYRTPLMTAKAIASLDALSGGRVVAGIGTGYLEGEFEALGASFAQRNAWTDQTLAVLEQAFTGEALEIEGLGVAARGNLLLPRPVQLPRPPIWIGGNTRRATERVVEHGSGWMPIFAPVGFNEQVRSRAISSLAELGDRIAELHAMLQAAGRAPDEVEVAFHPTVLPVFGTELPSMDATVEQLEELSAMGVTTALVSAPELDLDAVVGTISDWGAELVERAAPLGRPRSRDE